MAAAILVILNPLPIVDLIVGGFAGAAISGRLPFDLSMACGFLGTAVAAALNYTAVFVRHGVGSGAFNIPELFSAMILFGGVGVSIGMVFKYSKNQNG